MTFQERYAEEAIRWANIPVPFRHRGLTTRGCDCSGMLVGIAQVLGKLKSYKLRKYKFDWNLHSGACDIITTELDKFADRVTKSPMQPGDIPVFRFAKCNAHAGVFIKENLFIHSLSHHCCKYGIIKNSQWSDRWTLTYRLSNEKMARYS